jgi:glycosyltransferase involved in cell wall biosynthesis
MKPLVSVVIPTYKRPALLLKCLDALSKQEFPRVSYEVIVISDGPDDETRDAVLNFSTNIPGIRYYALPAKRGPAAARNLGWKAALAEFIAFTDDDCLPHSDWLQSLYEGYKNAGQEDVAFTGRTIVPIPATPTDYERNIAHLQEAEFITANCACTLSALERINGLDEAFTMAWREDSDFQFKLIRNAIPIYSLKNACVTHPVRKAPWGISIREEKKGMFNPLLQKKHPDLCRERLSLAPPWHYYAMIACCLLVLIGSLMRLDWIVYPALLVWLILLVNFIVKRLRNTSRRASHIAEMIFTSPLLPFLSVYWWWYGVFRFKAFSFAKNQ